MPKVVINKFATYTGHRDCVYTLEHSTEDKKFFSASGDGMVVEWDFLEPDNGKLIAKVANSVYALCLLKDYNQLLVGHNFEGIHLIDLTNNKELKSLKLTDAAIFDIKFFEGKIYVATGDGCLHIVDYNSFTITDTIVLSEKSVRCLAIHPSGLLAAGDSDFGINILNISSGLIKNIPQAHTNSVFTVSFSPDGSYLLSAGRDAHFKVWALPNFVLKKEVAAHLFAINHLVYSPDGAHFATCSMDKSVKVWDSKTFDLLKVIDKSRHAGHGTSVNKLSWLKHQDLLVSASDDRNISVWNVNFGDS